MRSILSPSKIGKRQSCFNVSDLINVSSAIISSASRRKENVEGFYWKFNFTQRLCHHAMWLWEPIKLCSRARQKKCINFKGNPTSQKFAMVEVKECDLIHGGNGKWKIWVSSMTWFLLSCHNSFGASHWKDSEFFDAWFI